MALFLCLILSLSISLHEVDGRNHNVPEIHHGFGRSQDLKSILPTIDNEFDCVDVYKQPAFQHPLLKSHKIQLYPTFSRRTMQSRSSDGDNNFKVENFTKGCPPGKVPIHNRIKVKHQKNITLESHAEDFRQFSQSYPGHHFATLDTTQNTMYRGASAAISIYNLSLQQNQYSLSQIWLQSGPPTELNSIEVGIGIHPNLYGDNRPRVTGYWTADNFQRTGCFNILCPGFVQVDSKYTFGEPIEPSSTIGTKEKYATIVTVKQDQLTGHWWLTAYGDDKYINFGYWPKEIFTHLSEGSTLIRYGGKTFAPPNMISPPMGSGNLPQTLFLNSAYMADLEIVDSNYNRYDVNPDDMKSYCDTSSSCYDLLYHGNVGPPFRQAFLFGGPGGQCGI